MEGEEGCDVSIVAKVSGCPFPTLTWQKASVAKPEEKAAVQYDQHINKLVTQDKCTLLIQQASRLDSALYSLTASNSLGTVTKDIKLSVLGEKLLTCCGMSSHVSCYINVLPSLSFFPSLQDRLVRLWDPSSSPRCLQRGLAWPGTLQ